LRNGWRADGVLLVLPEALRGGFWASINLTQTVTGTPILLHAVVAIVFWIKRLLDQACRRACG
jgi:hypothetical protein